MSEQRVKPAEMATLKFGREQVELKKRLLKNANISDAFHAIQIYREAKFSSGTQNEAFQRIGLDNIQKVRLFCSYLGNAVAKNSGRRGVGKEFEVSQVKTIYEELLSLFPEPDTSQKQDKGGKSGKGVNTGKTQSGGLQ